MTASTIMNANPIALKPTDTIATAIKIIMENRYRNVPVVNDSGIFVGSFSINTLLRLALPRAVIMEQGLDNVGFIRESLKSIHARVSEVENDPISKYMQTEPVTVAPDTPLIETMLLLYQTKISIPVVDPKTRKLVGVVSYFDVGEHVLQA